MSNCLLILALAVGQMPAPVQPIPPYQLKNFYVERLEISETGHNLRESQAQLQEAQKQLNDAIAAYTLRQKDFEKRWKGLLKTANVEEADWTIDLKAGTMTKKTPTPAITPTPKPK